MKHIALPLAAAILLAACTTTRSDAGWTGGPGAQSFPTAYSVCEQSSYGIEINFTNCMAGRGWVRNKASRSSPQ